MHRLKQQLQAKITFASTAISEKLECIAVLDEELESLRDADGNRFETFIKSLQDPTTDDGPKLFAHLEIEELNRQYTARLKRDLEKIDKDEAAQRKKLLVSLY